MIQLRAAWQEGLLLSDVGHFRNAEAAILRARKGFVEQGLLYETAHVDMDLAQLYSKMGLDEKARRAAEEAEPVLREFGVLKT
jgi:hypothetical protein